jgi:hypothetical protein
LRNTIKVTPELIASTVAKFAELGVTRAMLEKKIQRRVESITPALVSQLGKIYNSLKDGMSVPADWFEMPTHVEQIATETPAGGTTKTSRVAEQLAARAKTETPPAPTPEEPQQTELTPTPQPTHNFAKMTPELIADAIDQEAIAHSIGVADLKEIVDSFGGLNKSTAPGIVNAIRTHKK